MKSPIHLTFQVASLLFLDQPAGSGFSYAKTPEAYITNDTSAAMQVYSFLRKVRSFSRWKQLLFLFLSKHISSLHICHKFFERLLYFTYCLATNSSNVSLLRLSLQWLVEHPKFLNNQLYIGADSYSGIVLPIIVQEIYNGTHRYLKVLVVLVIELVMKKRSNLKQNRHIACHNIKNTDSFHLASTDQMKSFLKRDYAPTQVWILVSIFCR